MNGNRGFFSSLFPAMAAISVVPLAAFALLSIVWTRDFTLELSAREMLETARIASNSVLDGIKAGKPLEETVKDSVNGSSVRLTVMRSDGTVLADTQSDAASMENHLYREEIRSALETGSGTDIRRSVSTGTEYVYAAVSVTPTGVDGRMVVRAALDVPFINAKFLSLAVPLAVALAVLMSLSVVAAAWSAGRLKRPVDTIGRAAESWAAGNLDAVAAVREPRELAILADIMNRMARELDDRIRIIERSRDETVAIFRSMTEAVAVTDESGIIVASNPAFDQLFPAEGGNTQTSILERTRNTAVTEAEAGARAGTPIQDDIVMYGATPSRHTVVAAPLYGGKGAVLVLNDVTKLLKFETIRKDFTANVSHELKTPIQSIKGFAETLISGAIDDPAASRKFLGIILKHTERMEALINDLLSLARLEERDSADGLTFLPIPVRTVVEKSFETASVIAASRRISLEMEITGEPAIQGSEGLIVQALGNLLDNAVKYSPEGSSVTVGARTEGSFCVIDVADSGMGIGAKDLERVFERFYRADKSRVRPETGGTGGTGLGLAIVKHIVQVHGGSVRVKSALGMGSTFTLELPLSAQTRLDQGS